MKALKKAYDPKNKFGFYNLVPAVWTIDESEETWENVSLGVSVLAISPLLNTDSNPFFDD